MGGMWFSQCDSSEPHPRITVLGWPCPRINLCIFVLYSVETVSDHPFILSSADENIVNSVGYWKFNPGQDTVNFDESPANPTLTTIIPRARSISVGSSRGPNQNGNGESMPQRSIETSEKGKLALRSNDSPV